MAETNPFDQFDEGPAPASSEANPFDQFDAKPAPMPKTSAALATVPDETIPATTEAEGGLTPSETEGWRQTLSSVLPAIGARIESKLAGAEEWKSKGDYADARKKLWQSRVLPGANLESRDAGINLPEHPDVLYQAKRLGIRPDVFTRDWPDYQNMSPKELEEFQSQQIERMNAAEAKQREGQGRRQQAAVVASEVRGEAGLGDSEWTPRALAFDALTGIPDLLVGAAGTVAGGPLVGAGAMMASIAPEEYSAAKNAGVDEDKAATYALLSTVAQAVPEVPVLKILEGGAGGRSIVRKAVGDALADSPMGKVAGTAVTQGVSQAVIQSLQEAIDAGMIDEPANLKDSIERIARAGVLGTAMGVPLGGMHAAMSRAPKPTTLREITEHPLEPRPGQPGLPEGAGPADRAGAEVPERAPARAEAPAAEPAAAAQGAPARGPETRAALEALQDKSISPPQLEHLENLGLARRNDVGVPFMLPAGRRALAEFAKQPETAQARPETSPEPAQYKPTGDAMVDRIATDKDLRTELERMKGETGWAQVGGRVLMDQEGKVTGRTSWIPNAEWWRERPKGLTEDQVHLAVDKALKGEELGKRERSMVEHMVDTADKAAQAPQEEFRGALEQARADTETAPTEAQKKAGNYAKGELQYVPGLTFTMENPKGSTRSGTDSNGKTWLRELAHDYGYINRTAGADGDHVDAFLTGKPDTGHAFIVNQVDPRTGEFDEHKLILGAKDLDEAKATYKANYPQGWKGMGSIVEMPTPRLKGWLEHADMGKPAAPSEPRRDVGARQRVSSMTPEEMRSTLLTHELTGLPNRRAYDEAPKLAHQVAVDVDSLKWVNDNLGHQHGDELLKTVAEALKAQTGHAFHISGDEFVVQAHSPEEAHEVMREVADSLAGARLEAKGPNGEVVELNGLGLSYGVGRGLHEADRNLSAHKASRETRGERAARGEKPPGAAVRARGRERLEAESHVAEKAGVEHERIREDLAEYTNAHPVSAGGGELGAVEEVRRNVPAGANLQLFTSDEAPSAASARTQTHTGLTETGRFSSGIKQVRRWQDAAHILAPLRKSPQENMMALVVDAKGRPLAVLRHSIGHQTGASATPHLIVGAVGKVEGAAGVWFGHNHPSATPQQSEADQMITNRLHELMRGSGIDPLGMIVVTPGGLESSFYKPGYAGSETGKTTAAARGKRGAVPVLERRFTRLPPTTDRGMLATSPELARRAVEAAGEKSGVLLLDARHRVAAVLPMHPKEMAPLRTGDRTSGTLHVMRAVEDSNASAAIAFGQRGDEAPLANLGGLLSESGVRLLDTMVHDGGVWLSHNAGQVKGLVQKESFYARREYTGPGLHRSEVAQTVRNAIRESGMRAAPNFPHVEVHQDYTTLPRDLRDKVIQDRSEETAGAVYDPETGRIHMISDNLGTNREALETLWHEAVGHHGLRLIMDADRYANVMDGVWNAMPDRVRRTAERNGLDVQDLQQRRLAAEEVIAYAAGQHMAGTAIDKPLRPLWQRAVDAIRAFFARMRGTPFTDDKAIAKLIGESKRALESGTAMQRMGAIAQSQRAEVFYSPVERAVTNSKQGKASADQWLSTIRKTPGIKPEELEWMNLEPWLKEQKGPVTREQLAEYVRANKLELEETHFGGLGEIGRQTEHEQLQMRLAEQLRAMGHEVGFDPDGSLDYLRIRREGQEDLEPDNFEEVPEEIRPIVQQLDEVSHRVASAHPLEGREGGGRPQYEEFTLPGGKNYRELLIRLPTPGYYPGRRDLPAGTHAFRSQHWEQPNVLAHVRVKDRTDAEGKKTLFLEELQSDWHQKGREKGYSDMSPQSLYDRADQDLRELRGPALEAARRNDSLGFGSEHEALAAIRTHADWKDRWPDVPPADQDLLDRYRDAFRRRVEATSNDRVPDAPFKTSWPMLIMKRMIRHAAENGHERIAWTTGEQQAERYDLQKHVHTVGWSKHSDGKRTVTMDAPGHVIRFTVDTEGNVETAHTASAHGLPGNHLSEVVGAELAKRIMGEDIGNLTGQDLRVGGHGQRGFYDDILPRETNKLIRKYGSEVGETRLPEPVETTIYTRGRPLEVVHMRDHTGAEIPDQWGISHEGGVVWGSYLSREDARAALERHTEMFDEGPPHFQAHSFDITPQMREQALSQGFPMFWKKPSQQTLGLKQGQGPGWYEAVRRAVTYLHENPVTRDIRKLINPSKLSEEAKRTATIARAAIGSLAHQTFETQEALEHFSRQIDRLPPEEQLGMMDAIEHGVPQQNADLQGVADALRKQLDTWRDKVRGLGTGALDNFIENYFPHYWSQPNEAQRMVATIMGRRPLRGPASFLKMRTIPTIKEGMDAGLTPLTINPLVMTLLKVREMQRFVSGVKMMQSFKDAGLAKFLPATTPMPEGWAEIKDNIARVRQWSEEEQGFIERGKYIMPEDGARLINNHLSRSVLSDFAPTYVLRMGGNLLNALQLGFSAFHLGFTTLDASISKNALAIERLAHGEVGRGMAALAEGMTPAGAIMNVRRGYKLMKAYADPSGATPEMARLAQALEVAGGRTTMDRYFMAVHGVNPFRGVGIRSLAGDIRTALKGPAPIAETGKAIANFPVEYATRAYRELQGMTKTMPLLAIPFETAGRVVRGSTSLIMEHLVPLQKLGVFSDLAQDYLRRNPAATSDQIARSMQQAWESVDNRLGEMVYDNLFWNRTFKDAMHLAVRAVGWNAGTIREIGGAPIDVLTAVDKLARTGKLTADDIGHKIPYVIAMTMTTAALGATINYMFTGQGPQELKDYFFPRTGGTTTHGTPQRLSLPSYVKDIYEYSQRPGTTIANKLNPIFSTLSDIWRNQDYFGEPISEPEAGAWTQAKQRAEFAVKEATPFSIQGRAHIEGSDTQGVSGAIKRTLPFIGVTPAPGYVTSPDQIDRRERYEAETKYAREMKYKLNKAMAAHDQAAIDEYKERYIQAQRRAKELEVQTKKDKADSARARRQHATSMRQQGFPATASLIASLPLEPDAAAREYFRGRV